MLRSLAYALVPLACLVFGGCGSNSKSKTVAKPNLPKVEAEDDKLIVNGKEYGKLKSGDEIRVDPRTGQVFVNGEKR